MIAYGPVPSRRLGRSLGINNVPAKTCSYSCVYCQLGRTTEKSIDRQSFYDVKNITKEVTLKIKTSLKVGEKIDYLTFVPDGEPTLDINLGEEINRLQREKIPIAVITNSSLIWRKDVQDDLSHADLVSLKVDAVSERLWKRIDRPHKSLKLVKILSGIIEFSERFSGTLITETMFIDKIDYTKEIRKIADFLLKLKINKAYIAIPTRPPGEKWVKPAKEELINKSYQIFTKALGKESVEYLIGYEGDVFSLTGNIEKDLLSITSVHPMREDAIKRLLTKANTDWGVITKLINQGKLVKLEYLKHNYYMRKLPSRR